MLKVVGGASSIGVYLCISSVVGGILVLEILGGMCRFVRFLSFVFGISRVSKRWALFSFGLFLHVCFSGISLLYSDARRMFPGSSPATATYQFYEGGVKSTTTCSRLERLFSHVTAN